MNGIKKASNNNNVSYTHRKENKTRLGETDKDMQWYKRDD